MIKVKLSENKINQIKDICKSFNNEKGEVINVLHKVQSALGYLPAEVQEVVASELGLPTAHVYGVVTFYSFFSMIPKGEYPISVCMGTACYVRSAEKVLDELKQELGIGLGETTPDGKFSLNCLRCVGACGLAPVVIIGEKVHGRVEPSQVKEILAQYE